jgi:hypothetical protein
VSVDRWNVNPFSSSYQCEDGVFVLYSEFESRVRELEAERDRMKEENERMEKVIKKMIHADPRQLWNIAAAEVMEENTKLRARHAALVEAFEQAEGEHPLSCEYADDARYTWPDRWSIIKAALAEDK